VNIHRNQNTQYPSFFFYFYNVIHVTASPPQDKGFYRRTTLLIHIRAGKIMEKKPLIMVSLCAVVILVLASLGNVVGYQSVQSSVGDLPLFETRIQRATNQQQKSIIPQYIGMGRGKLLQFPMKDNRTEQLRKVIDILSNMDDTTFERFTELCIQKARQNDILRDVSHYQIVQSLLLLKTNADAIIYTYTNRNNQDNPTSLPTYCGSDTMCGGWYPGCWIGVILVLIFLLFIFIPFVVPILSILDFLTIGSAPSCENIS
jgi:hypothetical protein